MQTKFTIHIASHYSAGRLAVLETVLRAVASWRNCRISVTLNVNNDQFFNSDSYQRMQGHFSAQGHVLGIHTAKKLADPWLLTWEHKQFLPQWLASAGAGNDYFIYMEDDLVITQQNIQHFLSHLPRLQRHGLIPGFMRFETRGRKRYLLDLIAPEPPGMHWTREVEGRLYHANANPYWAGYILNRALAEEYVASRSFSFERSKEVSIWGTPERAAMGLTFESPPLGLHSRVVVPMLGGQADPACLIWHASNTYSLKNDPKHARLTMAEAYPH